MLVIPFGSINLSHKECDWLICQSHHTQMNSNGEYLWKLDLCTYNKYDLCHTEHILKPTFLDSAAVFMLCPMLSSSVLMLWSFFWRPNICWKEERELGTKEVYLCNNQRIFFLGNRGALENIGMCWEQKLIFPLWKIQPKLGTFWCWVFLQM